MQNRGTAYYKTGKKTEARKDWRKAQSLGDSERNLRTPVFADKQHPPTV